MIHPRLMGEPPVPHRGVESNLAAFVLQPRIDPVTASNVQGTGTQPRSADVAVGVTPAVGDAQRVVLLLNRVHPAGARQAARAGCAQRVVQLRRAVAAPAQSAVITPRRDEHDRGPDHRRAAGTYLVRVQVDGADSPLSATPAVNSWLRW